MNIADRSIMHSIPIAAAAALLAALWLLGGVGSTRARGADAYFKDVRDAVAALPLGIGPWVGNDQPIGDVASEMLRPNAILSRQFVDPIQPSDNQFTLLIVHCGDPRDMIGHYPPSCYPGRGWVIQPQQQRDVPTGLDPHTYEGSPVPSQIRRYQFHLKDRDDVRLVVYNVFAIPSADMPFGLDMRSVDVVARSPKAAGLGVAQIQIVLPGEPEQAFEAAVVDRVLRAVQPVMSTIARGPAKVPTPTTTGPATTLPPAMLTRRSVP